MIAIPFGETSTTHRRRCAVLSFRPKITENADRTEGPCLCSISTAWWIDLRMGVREARRCPAHRCRRALDADQRPTEYCLRVARDVLDDLLGRILRQIGMLSQLRSCERYDEPETLPSSICLICPTVLTADSSPCRTEFPPPWSVEETDACFIVVAVKTRHKLRSTNAKPAQCPPSQGRPISFRLPLRNTLRGPGAYLRCAK